MNIQLTSEQQMMQKMVREFAEKEITPYITSMENGEFPYDVIKKMGELGLLGIPIDGKYGGSNMDFMSYIIAIHENSKISAAVGGILSVDTYGGTYPIISLCTYGQKQK